jgi:hypothetical protein
MEATVSFSEIVNKTHCPFAKPSKTGPPLVIHGAKVERELRAHREHIASFFKHAKSNAHDGMLITFEDASLGHTLEALAALTNRFFAVLSDLFPGVYLLDSPSSDDAWFPTIEGEQFFLVSFAPCYPPESPRFTYGDTKTYFVMQPASAFVRNAAAVEKLRKHIQETFAAAGRPYDPVLANVKNDMFKMVMPLGPKAAHVSWWRRG